MVLALEHIRRLRGLSQRELAEKAGVSPATVYELEVGKRPTPRPSTLRKLAGALEVEIADLLGEPVLAGKAEAPRGAGQAQTSEHARKRGEGWDFRRAIDLVMEAARKEALRSEQAANRAFESGQPQGMFTDELMDAGRRILDELEPPSVMEALRQLAFEQALLERDNANLREALTQAGGEIHDREQARAEKT